MKKGAMFGLDARIALAIFGALSVISGAALYNAIQNSKATVLFTEMKEIGKAWEQYLLDNGKDLPKAPLGIDNRNVSNLVINSENLSTWKGPYINLEVSDEFSHLLNHNLYGNVHLVSAKNGIWGDEESWNVSNICDNENPCFMWVHITSITKGICKNIDDLFDDGFVTTGIIRCIFIDDIWNERIYLNYAPYEKI